MYSDPASEHAGVEQKRSIVVVYPAGNAGLLRSWSNTGGQQLASANPDRMLP